MRASRGARLIAVASVVGAGAACGGDALGSGTPTWAEDVAPILYTRCVGCHRPGGPGPFHLLTYEDAVEQAPTIAEATGTGKMPPWLPVTGDVAFAGDRRLTDRERRTIREWVEGGTPSGDPASVSPPEFPEGWRLGVPDLIVHTDEDFPVPASGGDIFRNLVVTVPIDHRVWVRGMEIRFSDPRVVHHSMITLDATSSSRRQAGLDSLPGFDGMFVATEAVGPSGFLLGWTPGKEPALSPEGLAFPLDPGTDIVVQLHLRPYGEPAEVGAELGLHLAEEPPSRTPFTIRLGVEDIDIAPGDPSYVRTDEYVLPVDLEVLGMYPHAHYVGHAISLDAVRPDSTRLRVLDIPHWDFNWQDAYRLAEPLRLPAGTRLEARFEYDNGPDNPLNPNDPPIRVVYGPRSTDEMGELWIQTVPVRNEDLATLESDFGRKNMASKIEGWRHMLAIDPGEATAHAGLGTMDQAAGRHESAIEHFRAALASRPEYVLAHYNLAVSLQALGRADEAERELREVVRLDSTHVGAHNNLGILAVQSGRLDEAIRHFEAATRADPRHAEAHNNLGNALRQRGDLAGAATHIERALDLEPAYAAARLNLALVAWTLATSPDEAVRSAGDAVRLAERALSGAPSDPRLLDVVAAAYADAGRFEQAVAAEGRAIQAARAAGATPADLTGYEARLRLYGQRQPYRRR